MLAPECCRDTPNGGAAADTFLPVMLLLLLLLLLSLCRFVTKQCPYTSQHPSTADGA
jgi:hypothetical protein